MIRNMDQKPDMDGIDMIRDLAYQSIVKMDFWNAIIFFGKNVGSV